MDPTCDQTRQLAVIRLDSAHLMADRGTKLAHYSDRQYFPPIFNCCIIRNLNVVHSATMTSQDGEPSVSARLRVRNAMGERVHAIQLDALRVQFANSRDDGGWEDSTRIGVRALNVAQRMLSIYCTHSDIYCTVYRCLLFTQHEVWMISDFCTRVRVH